MNEFYFEYQVFDSQGNDVSKNIKLFLERDYNGGSNGVSLNMCIFDWNKYGVSARNSSVGDDKGQSIEDDALPLIRYTAAKVFHNPHASDSVGDTADSHKGVVIASKLFERAKHYVTNNGKILITRERDLFSGAGTIEFYTDIKDENKNGVKFFYFINCYNRVKLHYTYQSRGDKVKFKFNQKATADLHFYLMTGLNGLAPCLVEDVTDETVHTLKKGENSFAAQVKTSDGVKPQFRLTLKDKTQKKLYLLVYEKETASSERLNDDPKIKADGGRNQRCPFCLRIMRPSESKTRGSKRIVTCQGNGLDATQNQDVQDNNVEGLDVSGFRGKNRICCYCYDFSDESKLNRKYREWKRLSGKISDNEDVLTGRAKAQVNNRFDAILLPEEYEKGRNMVGCILGASGVGKSVFLSRLMNVTFSDEGIADANAATVGQAISRYVSSAGCYFPHGYDASAKTFTRAQWTGFFNKSDADFAVDPAHPAQNNPSGLLLDYGIKVYDKIAKRTDEGKRELLQRHPFTLSIGRYSNIVLFDLPGEALRVNKYVKGTLPTVDAADFLILLINMDSKSAVAQNLERTSNEFKNCIRAITERKCDEGTLKVGGELQKNDINNIALAVVLCKFDELEEQFDINSAVRSSSLDLNDKRFGNSEIQRNIDSASDEVERFLSTTINTGHFSALKEQIEKFKYRKYFAVSALGEPDCTLKADGAGELENPNLLYLAAPKRIEHVLLWLMWQGGTIA